MKKKFCIKNKAIKIEEKKLQIEQTKNIEIIKNINEQENLDNAKQVLKKEYK